MEVLEGDGLLDRRAGSFVVRPPVQVAHLEPAAEDEHRTRRREVPVHAVILEVVNHLGDHGLVLDGLVGLSLDHHVAAELTGEDDQRSIEQAAFFEVEDQLRDGRVDHALELRHTCVTILVRIPVLKGNVLRRDLDEARSGFDQTAGQEATASEPSGVVDVEFLLGLERQVERLGRRRCQQAIGVVHRSHERFLLEVGPMAADGTRRGELLVFLVPVFESARRHSLGGLDACPGLARMRDHERPIFAPEEARLMERLEFLAFPDSHALADVDESRDVRVVRPERPRDDRPHVRGGHGERRDVTGVPVILMARVENEPEVGADERPDQRPAIHDRCDAFEALGELDVVDGRVDRRKRAEHAVGIEAALERHIPLRIERLGVSHPAGHPKEDHRIDLGLDFLRIGEKRTRVGRRQGRKRRRARRSEEVPSVDASRSVRVPTVHVSGSFRSLSRSVESRAD